MVQRSAWGRDICSGVAWLALIGCGDADGVADGELVTDCASYEPRRVDHLWAIAPDLDGDGVDEVVQFDYPDVVSIGRLDGAGRPHLEVELEETSYVDVRVGDLDADGVLDVAIASRWLGQLGIFYGPFEGGGRSSLTDAPTTLADPISGGLANLLGAGMLIGDVTGDGVNDLTVGRPAEGEEACLGTEDSLIFAGPLSPGALDADAPSARIPAEVGSCFGERFALVDGELVVSGAHTTQIHALPYAAGARPRSVAQHVIRAGDFDEDGLLDWATRYSIVHGTGETSWFELSRTEATQIVEAAGHPALHATITSEERELLVRMDELEMDVDRWTVVAELAPDHARAVSAGDLDGDGTLDLAVGYYAGTDHGVALLCRP